MTNTIAAAMVAGQIFLTNSGPYLVLTNPPLVVQYSESKKTLTIRDDYTNHLFIGTNEFRIMRITNVVTNVVITVEPKKD